MNPSNLPKGSGNSRQILSSLHSADDFGVKYNNIQDLEHLTNALKENYEIMVDMQGKTFADLR